MIDLEYIAHLARYGITAPEYLTDARVAPVSDELEGV